MSIVSLSGVDGIGKSEQIALLQQHPLVRYSGPLTQYSNKWPSFSPREHFEWWFKNVPFEEFLELIIESLNERHRKAVPGLLNIYDRGERMFKAVCVATLLTRVSNIDFQCAKTIVDKAFRKRLAYKEGLEVFLVRDKKYYPTATSLSEANRLERTSSFTLEQNNIYAQYQSYLNVALDHYRSEMGCRTISVDSCILSIHNQLRTILSEMTGKDLPPLCAGLEELTVFSGMSEAGKSSFAETLHERSGSYRLKLKYFEQLASREGLKASRETMGHEIVRFFDDHYYIRKATLESLHGPDLGLHLKALFGNRCKIVFIDTPESLRVQRLAQQLRVPEAVATAIVREKDAVKLSRGITEVAKTADVCFENTGNNFEESFNTFLKVLYK